MPLLGAEHSLAAELRFPIFVQSLTQEGVEEQRKLRRGLPAKARSYITRFTAALEAETRESERFDYRVLLTPLRGPKSEADMAMTFVEAEDLTEEKRAQLEALLPFGFRVHHFTALHFTRCGSAMEYILTAARPSRRRPTRATVCTTSPSGSTFTRRRT